MVKVTFAVRENNMDTIRKIALDVSDPNSPNYGRYLTQTQIDEITAPAAADVAAVRSWLVPSLHQRMGPGHRCRHPALWQAPRRGDRQ